jgi:glycosyltransferase involved in cell wall biosynthesis
MPWVQTLHDVIPLVFDDPDLEPERRRWRRQSGRYRKATAVVAVSRYSADVGISLLKLDPARVHVIPHGVGQEFAPPGRSRDERRDLLMVGEYSRRKGYPEAFAVVAALTELGYPHRLRVTGRIAPWVRPAVEGVRTASPRPDRVDLLGFVDDLVAEYQRAQVLVMSSRYEGFGLPALEAMACGTPVVAFDNSSLTEVVGAAGILVPDGDVPEMVRAVRSLLDDPGRWREFSQRGLEWAKRFSWERSVSTHAELFVRVSQGID